MAARPFSRALLRPGDCLLYAPKWWSLTGWIIAIKTWHWINHCEAYTGEDERGIPSSVASRDGIGVNKYPFRADHLVAVLRPTQPFDVALAMRWFRSHAKGQQYDWFGLVRFAWRARVVRERNDNKQFCSEFLARWYRAGGLDLFNRTDADAIAPFQFQCSPYLMSVWSADEQDTAEDEAALW